MEGLDHRRKFIPNPAFVGRKRELNWLFERFNERRAPLVISGPPGVGKTALLEQFLASLRLRYPPLYLSPRLPPNEKFGAIMASIEELYRKREVPEIVAIDEAEGLDDRQLNSIAGAALNFKPIRTLIISTRYLPEITRAEVLRLESMSAEESQEMLKGLLDVGFPSDEIPRAIKAAGGLPFALQLIANLTRGQDLEEVRRLVRGEIYTINRRFILPEKKLLEEVKPRILLANDALVERLRREPNEIYQLPPRKFEELIAELLTDLGYEVELTPETRDGGKDILAYMNTDLGKMLCLVEAKKYRRDRTVGVGLVRQLYGTLADADATSAMLVTTSSFSPDAKDFENRHKYKLALRDYGNVVEWIEKYKKRQNPH